MTIEPAPQPAQTQASLNPVITWLLRNPLRVLGGLLLVALFMIAIANVASGEVTLKTLINQFIFGLAQGSIYALVALGYTLVYGILFMINFAHGEVFMSGAYIGFFAITVMDQIGWLADYTLLALLFTMLVGVVASVTIATLLERIAYRPLRSAPRLVPLITAIGASITLQQLFLVLFGSSPRTYPTVSLFVGQGVLGCEVLEGVALCPGIDLIDGRYDVTILGEIIRIRPIFFVVMFVAMIMMAGLWFFVQRTRTGKAMRAVAEDRSTAALMGINVDRVIVITFVLGAALAGAAAVLFALYNRQVTPFMGFVPGIKAFTAAVIGGIGNIPGAMFGGLFLGVIEATFPTLLGLPHQLKDLVAFSTLVLFMIFRPTGIFGEVLSEKKA
jgi:branched-chain amino acid transport system permease protein